MNFEESVRRYLGEKKITEKELKGKCKKCGEKLSDIEDADYETSWVVMDNGDEYCGDCGPGEGKGKRYNVKGSIGIDLEHPKNI